MNSRSRRRVTIAPPSERAAQTSSSTTSTRNSVIEYDDDAPTAVRIARRIQRIDGLDIHDVNDNVLIVDPLEAAQKFINSTASGDDDEE